MMTDEAIRLAGRFDADRAMADLRRLCALGPRPAGSAANAEQRRSVAEHFRACGGSVIEQPFQGCHPLSGDPVAMANLVGSWGGGRGGRVLVGAHGDTRPMADRERDPARRLGPFVGANDGASGVAALLELARHLGALPSGTGVDLVVFDAEELVFDEVGDYCLGSSAFADWSIGSGVDYRAALVLDMVAGEGMVLEPEGFSLGYAPGLVDEVWAVARRLGAGAFGEGVGPYVEDDHLPLLAAGIPAIALVDLGYPQWHTLDDVPDRCSAGSLGQVGRVVLGWLAGRDAGGGRRWA